MENSLDDADENGDASGGGNRFKDLEWWLLTGDIQRPRGAEGNRGRPLEPETRSRFDSLEIVSLGPGYRGVAANRDIEPGELVLSVDVRFLITVEMGRRTPIGRRMSMAHPPLELSAAKHCFTAVFIL